MTADFPADHGYASLSAEFVKMTGAPPAAQQLSNRVEQELTFEIPHRAGVTITGEVEPVDAADKKSAAFNVSAARLQWVGTSEAPDRTRFAVAFPHPGTFDLNLWATDRGGKTVSTSFRLRVDKGSDHGFFSIDPNVLALTGPPLEGATVSNHVGRTFQLRFRLSSGVSVEAQWERSAGPGNRGTRATLSTAQGITTVGFTFPAAGTYVVTIWARKAGRFPGAIGSLVLAD